MGFVSPQSITMNCLRLSLYCAHISRRQKQRGWCSSHYSSISTLGGLNNMTSLCFPKFCLSGSKTMKGRHGGGVLSACVVSWCATAYHVSAALEGFSGTSGTSLHALRALPSPTVSRCDRFLITMFPRAVVLLHTQQWTTLACHTDSVASHHLECHELALRLQKPKAQTNKLVFVEMRDGEAVC